MIFIARFLWCSKKVSYKSQLSCRHLRHGRVSPNARVVIWRKTCLALKQTRTKTNFTPAIKYASTDTDTDTHTDTDTDTDTHTHTHTDTDTHRHTQTHTHTHTHTDTHRQTHTDTYTHTHTHTDTQTQTQTQTHTHTHTHTHTLKHTHTHTRAHVSFCDRCGGEGRSRASVSKCQTKYPPASKPSTLALSKIGTGAISLDLVTAKLPPKPQCQLPASQETEKDGRQYLTLHWHR